jgi:hypothetical protein
MNINEFLKPLKKLSIKWLSPINLDFSVKEQGSPLEKLLISETKSITSKAQFSIRCTYGSKVRTGREESIDGALTKCISMAEEFRSNAIDGKYSDINDTLKSKLSSSLFNLEKTGNISLGYYEHKALIKCDGCYGNRDITCGGCNGNGKTSTYNVEAQDEQITRDNHGNVTRTPINYQSVERKHQCTVCWGSGRVTCGTCNGHGVNTHVEYNELYSKAIKPNYTFPDKFSKHLSWGNDYIKNTNRSILNNSINWNTREQTVTYQGKGDYLVKLPGEISITEGTVVYKESLRDHTSNSFGNSFEGSVKMIGHNIYDLNYLFDPLVKEKVDGKIYDPKAISPLLSSLLAETSDENNNFTFVPVSQFKDMNPISYKAAKSIQTVINKLSDSIKSKQKSISTMKIIINSIKVFLSLLITMLLIDYQSSAQDPYEGFGLVPFTQNIIEVIRYSPSMISGSQPIELCISLLLLFIVSIVLMKTFGAVKSWSYTRIIKWCCASFLLVPAFALQFAEPLSQIQNSNQNITISYIPWIDLVMFSLLGGIFLARKQNFLNQKKIASKYESSALLGSLNYL